MERSEKRFLKPETSGSKFFNDESAAVFERIRYDGSKTTFKGFFNRINEATKLVANAMDLNRDHTKNLQALQRTQKFFSLIFRFIQYKDVQYYRYEQIEHHVVKKYLERIQNKHQGTTVPLDETTDVELSNDEESSRGHWHRERQAYSQELKDFHECVFDVLKASIKEEKFDEIYYKICGIGYDTPMHVPQKLFLTEDVYILRAVWQEFSKIQHAEIPFSIMWDDFNLDETWRFYKKAICKTGYLMQYPARLFKVIDFFQENIYRYTDQKVVHREIEAFTENIVTPHYDRSESAFGNIDYKLRWLQFCVTMDKFFGKFTGTGMFKPVTRAMSLRDRLKNLESPGKISDPESSKTPNSRQLE